MFGDLNEGGEARHSNYEFVVRMRKPQIKLRNWARNAGRGDNREWMPSRYPVLKNLCEPVRFVDRNIHGESNNLSI